jgi:glutathione-regulated potassium-efflux system ancillary protein KefF
MDLRSWACANRIQIIATLGATVWRELDTVALREAADCDFFSRNSSRGKSRDCRTSGFTLGRRTNGPSRASMTGCPSPIDRGVGTATWRNGGRYHCHGPPGGAGNLRRAGPAYRLSRRGPMITVIYAHPYTQHSRAGRALQAAISNLPSVQVRNLYQLYPDFHIQVQAEQQALLATRTIVFQHPLHWYHMPALLSLWCEKVLGYGWAYGHGSDGQPTQALAGKRFLWVATAGGEESAYDAGGYNRFPMSQIATPIQQTALFCGMQWLPPYTVYHAGKISEDELLLAAEGYRLRLIDELVLLRHFSFDALLSF